MIPPWKAELKMSLKQFERHSHKIPCDKEGGATAEEELHGRDDAEEHDLERDPAVGSHTGPLGGGSQKKKKSHRLEISCDGNSAVKNPTLKIVEPRFFRSALHLLYT